MRARLALVLVVALGLAGCESSSRQKNTGPQLTPDGRDPMASKWYEKLRQKAYAKRRFKALFQGDVSPKAGAIAHGYLSIWWDGESLIWRTSAPVAGSGRGGTLRLESGSEADTPFEGGLSGRDAIGALLGVLDLPPTGPAVPTLHVYRVPLDTERSAFLSADGTVVRLEFPGSVEVVFNPGEGVPRRIVANSPKGRAVLDLVSYGAWPKDEAVPPSP